MPYKNYEEIIAALYDDSCRNSKNPLIKNKEFSDWLFAGISGKCANQKPYQYAPGQEWEFDSSHLTPIEKVKLCEICGLNYRLLYDIDPTEIKFESSKELFLANLVNKDTISIPLLPVFKPKDRTKLKDKQTIFWGEIIKNLCKAHTKLAFANEKVFVACLERNEKNPLSGANETITLENTFFAVSSDKKKEQEFHSMDYLIRQLNCTSITNKEFVNFIAMLVSPKGIAINEHINFLFLENLKRIISDWRFISKQIVTKISFNPANKDQIIIRGNFSIAGSSSPDAKELPDIGLVSYEIVVNTDCAVVIRNFAIQNLGRHLGPEQFCAFIDSLMAANQVPSSELRDAIVRNTHPAWLFMQTVLNLDNPDTLKALLSDTLLIATVEDATIEKTLKAFFKITACRSAAMCEAVADFYVQRSSNFIKSNPPIISESKWLEVLEIDSSVLTALKLVQKEGAILVNDYSFDTLCVFYEKLNELSNKAAAEKNSVVLERLNEIKKTLAANSIESSRIKQTLEHDLKETFFQHAEDLPSFCRNFVTQAHDFLKKYSNSKLLKDSLLSWSMEANTPQKSVQSMLQEKWNNVVEELLSSVTFEEYYPMHNFVRLFVKETLSLLGKRLFAKDVSMFRDDQADLQKALSDLVIAIAKAEFNMDGTLPEDQKVPLLNILRRLGQYVTNSNIDIAFEFNAYMQYLIGNGSVSPRDLDNFIKNLCLLKKTAEKQFSTEEKAKYAPLLAMLDRAQFWKDYAVWLNYEKQIKQLRNIEAQKIPCFDKCNVMPQEYINFIDQLNGSAFEKFIALCQICKFLDDNYTRSSSDSLSDKSELARLDHSHLILDMLPYLFKGQPLVAAESDFKNKTPLENLIIFSSNLARCLSDNETLTPAQKIEIIKHATSSYIRLSRQYYDPDNKASVPITFGRESLGEIRALLQETFLRMEQRNEQISQEQVTKLFSVCLALMQPYLPLNISEKPSFFLHKLLAAKNDESAQALIMEFKGYAPMLYGEGSPIYSVMRDKIKDHKESIAREIVAICQNSNSPEKLILLLTFINGLCKAEMVSDCPEVLGPIVFNQIIDSLLSEGKITKEDLDALPKKLNAILTEHFEAGSESYLKFKNILDCIITPAIKCSALPQPSVQSQSIRPAASTDDLWERIAKETTIIASSPETLLKFINGIISSKTLLKHLGQNGEEMKLGSAEVVSDFHGDLPSFIAFIQRIASSLQDPNNKTKYFFLGDYVDRGDGGLEIVIATLVLKLMFPDKVILLQGNHEHDCTSTSSTFFAAEIFGCKAVSQLFPNSPGKVTLPDSRHYGLFNSCSDNPALKKQLFDTFVALFRQMNVYSKFTVEQTPYLVVHGGIDHEMLIQGKRPFSHKVFSPDTNDEAIIMHLLGNEYTPDKALVGHEVSGRGSASMTYYGDDDLHDLGRVVICGHMHVQGWLKEPSPKDRTGVFVVTSSRFPTRNGSYLIPQIVHIDSNGVSPIYLTVPTRTFKNGLDEISDCFDKAKSPEELQFLLHWIMSQLIVNNIVSVEKKDGKEVLSLDKTNTTWKKCLKQYRDKCFVIMALFLTKYSEKIGAEKAAINFDTKKLLDIMQKVLQNTDRLSYLPSIEGGLENEVQKILGDAVRNYNTKYEHVSSEVVYKRLRNELDVLLTVAADLKNFLGDKENKVFPDFTSKCSILMPALSAIRSQNVDSKDNYGAVFYWAIDKLNLGKEGLLNAEEISNLELLTKVEPKPKEWDPANFSLFIGGLKLNHLCIRPFVSAVIEAVVDGSKTDASYLSYLQAIHEYGQALKLPGVEVIISHAIDKYVLESLPKDDEHMVEHIRRARQIEQQCLEQLRSLSQNPALVAKQGVPIESTEVKAMVSPSGPGLHKAPTPPPIDSVSQQRGAADLTTVMQCASGASPQ